MVLVELYNQMTLTERELFLSNQASISMPIHDRFSKDYCKHEAGKSFSNQQTIAVMEMMIFIMIRMLSFEMRWA